MQPQAAESRPLQGSGCPCSGRSISARQPGLHSKVTWSPPTGMRTHFYPLCMLAGFVAACIRLCHALLRVRKPLLREAAAAARVGHARREAAAAACKPL